MKFYKLNNTWVSWDELHNGYGYTTEPSVAVTYKSAHNGSSWGEDAGSGYYVGDIDDMVHGSFWCDSDYGWFELDGLVWNPEIYPSNATPLMMQNGGVTSPAVSLESDGVTYYLIKVIVADTGWITADEASELGWEVYDEMQGTFIVFDTVENKIVSAFTNELTYGEIEGIILQSPRLVYGVDISVPTAQFWFTDEGRNYTEDKELLSRSILRDENGNRIKSPDSTIYDNVPILAYMHINGDMLESTDGVIEYYGSGSLRTLTSLNGSAVGESVWSVFAERVFTLSFANTQLPGITITLPADETGYKGTSITLPTMTGEYESGGKTWKPSAWDIGAFGSSYTLNADTVAHLIFEEVQQYQEITLYYSTAYKYFQSDVTSGYTGNVSSGYCYQLYTDEQCTIPWTGYDYSNDYEVGWYNNGVWEPLISKVEDMPSTTYGEVKRGFILMDTGCMWHCLNVTNSSAYNARMQEVIRIYPKAQQHYALYFNYNSLYDNYSLGSNRPGYPWPSGTSGNYMAWFASYPVPTLVKFLGSAGNEFLPGGNVGSMEIKNNSSNALEVTRIGYTNNISVRCAIFTLDKPTLFAWTRTDKTNRSISSGTACKLYDENGNGIAYDDLYSYKVLGVLQASGANCSSERNVIQYASLLSSNSALAFMQTYGSVTASKIWYIKEQRNIIVNFGDPVTIPDGFTVDSVKCTKLFIKSSNISYSGHVIYFEYPGANVYSDDTDLALFGVGVNPCIEMFGFSNASTFAGFRLSVDFSRSGYATAVLASKLNTDGYFVKGEATLSSSYTTSTYVGHMQANPMMFRLYINGAVKSYHFNVPQSVWQYQNGVFSWLGNDTDTTDLAYWYKSAPDIQINLRPIT